MKVEDGAQKKHIGGCDMTRRISFFNWCRKDMNDERKINYKCNRATGYTEFSSEDYVEPNILFWLRNDAMVDKAELIDNEWYVELSERR